MEDYPPPARTPAIQDEEYARHEYRNTPARAETAVRLPAGAENYLNVAYGVASWLLTKDHKRIGLLYLITVTVMFFIGGFAIAMLG